MPAGADRSLPSTSADHVDPTVRFVSWNVREMPVPANRQETTTVVFGSTEFGRPKVQTGPRNATGHAEFVQAKYVAPDGAVVAVSYSPVSAAFSEFQVNVDSAAGALQEAPFVVVFTSSCWYWPQ